MCKHFVEQDVNVAIEPSAVGDREEDGEVVACQPYNRLLWEVKMWFAQGGGG